MQFFHLSVPKYAPPGQYILVDQKRSQRVKRSVLPPALWQQASLTKVLHQLLAKRLYRRRQGGCIGRVREAVQKTVREAMKKSLSFGHCPKVAPPSFWTPVG